MDTRQIRRFMEAKEIAEAFKMELSYGNDLFNIGLGKDGKLILCENFDTVDELWSYLHGYIKGTQR
jgi:hypothetical protein